MSTKQQDETPKQPQEQQAPQPAPEKPQDTTPAHNEEDEMETPLDYYETLGLKHSAGPSRIERAYRSLSLRYHPQNYAGSDGKANETRFAHISEAYQVLSDPEKRRKYDEYLMKNNDKFREYQKQAGVKAREEARKWKHLPVLHFRFHPYSPFNELFGYRPMNPFDQFNQFLSHGLFEDDDLDFYGFRQPQIGLGGFGGLSGFGGFPRIRDNFFGDREIRDLLHGTDEEFERVAKKAELKDTPQKKEEATAQAPTQTQNNPIEVSRTITKHTKIHNGIRTTVTETKKVHADGQVEHLIKEETEDKEGNRKVRYLDALPDSKRKEIADHQATKKECQGNDCPKKE